MGVTSLLLTRGHRVPEEHHIPATTVFDTTGRELIGMANALNEEESTEPGEQFFIGTGARAYRPRKNWRAESLNARANAGARFMQTQLCFNTDIIRAYTKGLVVDKQFIAGGDVNLTAKKKQCHASHGPNHGR